MRWVLVVDDDAPVRIALSEFLRISGFHVIEATNAGDAVKVLDRLSAKVHVMFSDIRMPGSADGFALARWVHEHHPNIPVLLTSGDIATAKRAHTLAPGGVFLPKPYDFDDVADLLRDIVTAAVH